MNDIAFLETVSVYSKIYMPLKNGNMKIEAHDKIVRCNIRYHGNIHMYMY